MSSLWPSSTLIITSSLLCTSSQECWPAQRPCTHSHVPLPKNAGQFRDHVHAGHQSTDALWACSTEPADLPGRLYHSNILLSYLSHQQLLSAHGEGVWPPCGHLQPFEIHTHHEQQGMHPTTTATNASSMPAQRIPWTEEPGELQSMGLQTVRHDLVVKQQQQQQQGISSAMSKLILTVRRVLKQLGL